jgi:hypothetical protein
MATSTTHTHVPLATVDVRELNSLRWGFMRALFPHFVEEVELGRYLKTLLRSTACRAVEIQPHQEAGGRRSSHVFDVFAVEDRAVR